MQKHAPLLSSLLVACVGFAAPLAAQTAPAPAPKKPAEQPAPQPAPKKPDAKKPDAKKPAPPAPAPAKPGPEANKPAPGPAAVPPASPAPAPPAPAASGDAPAPASQPTTAETERDLAPVDVELLASPFWGEVFIGDSPVGATPVTVKLSPGVHDVLFVEPDSDRAIRVDVVVHSDAKADGHRIMVSFDRGEVRALGDLTATVRTAWPDPVPPPDPGSTVCPENIPCMRTGKFAVWPRIRLRAMYELQQPDTQVLFIGNNDGFFVDQARLGLSGAYGDSFDFTLIIDGAGLLPNRLQNNPVQDTRPVLIDAFIHYAPFAFLQIWAGQTFMPGAVEGTTSRAQLIFTERSVASAGVRAGRNYEVDGLGVGRDVGVVVGARDLHLGPVRLDYLFAASNGNGSAKFGNDNKLPALFTRLSAGFERYINVGLGGHYNPRTTGQIPNLFAETDTQLFADLTASAFGLNFLAQAIVRQEVANSLFPEVTDINRAEYGFGATSWLYIDRPLGFSLFGLKPGARVSFYDPTRTFRDDTLLEGTIGVRYDPESYRLPISVMVDATTLVELTENGLGPLDNNRLTAMLMFAF